MVTPEMFQQVKQTHAPLIIGVVQCIHNPDLQPEMEKALKISEQNGWTALVKAIRAIIAGSRDASLLKELDEEDSIIVQAILEGLQDANSLPDPEAKPDASMAAPMLAGMIHQAARGDVNALNLVSQMAEQMSKTRGDMAQLSTVIKPLIDGERDVEKLTSKMGPQGESLIVSIVNELAKLEVH